MKSANCFTKNNLVEGKNKFSGRKIKEQKVLQSAFSKYRLSDKKSVNVKGGLTIQDIQAF